MTWKSIVHDVKDMATQSIKDETEYELKLVQSTTIEGDVGCEQAPITSHP